MRIVWENEHLRYAIGPDARNVEFADRRTGANWCAGNSVCARIRKDGKELPATAAVEKDGLLHLDFGRGDAHAVIRPIVRSHSLIWEVISLDGEGIEEFTFADVPLALEGAPDEPFAACALALNLQTNVAELPRPMSRLRAMCYPRFGFAGAKAALIGCPQAELRRIMQEVVREADELPHSPVGGPWALDEPTNRGSYLFNFGDLSLEKVDEWIALAKTLGFTQIDFHGGRSFRFGDCFPNPETYPDGLASFKAVIDRLHEAGIQAGLHTYAFFIDKTCPWVTPVPDPGLGKDATFTLAKEIGADDAAVPVVESTESMSAVTGFFVRNSATVQIDDELIVYTGVSKEPPYGFVGCQRGAYGTRPAPHKAGAQVHHLKECFGLFAPDPDAPLFEEVAAKTAEMFNTCGFDMIYFDALDGEDVLGGREYGWHYGSKFVFEVWKRLERPALIEMSTFHHHLWYVRSRMGAWDHPARSHKRFIDIHVAANEQYRRMFLPTNLGWWAIKTWSGHQGEPTFADDIEYLCAKALATDSSLSLMGIDPKTFAERPVMRRLAGIIRRYETLRRTGGVPEHIKAHLRTPGEEFVLDDRDGAPKFRPVQHIKHKVERMDGVANLWRVTNPFPAQPLRVRIEALVSPAAYDAPDALTIADFRDVAQFSDRDAAPGMKAALYPSSEQVKVGPVSGCYTATNERAGRGEASVKEAYSLESHGMREVRGPEPTWTKVGMTFAPPLNLEGHEAFGFWVYGDGKGEVLNLQLRCPPHVVAGIGDHYVIIDFVGWRYVTLIEPEGEQVDRYTWPYSGNVYAIYREGIDYRQIASLGLWYNNIPPGQTVTCYLSPIRALPLGKATLRNPTITIGGKRIRFPVEIETGSYLEFQPPDECILYGPDGDMLAKVKPEGDVPTVISGENEVTFVCEEPEGKTPRARVTITTVGDALAR